VDSFERLPAQLEEIISHTDGVGLQYLLPHAEQPGFRKVAWRAMFPHQGGRHRFFGLRQGFA
jgi:hypothetical protein